MRKRQALFGVTELKKDIYESQMLCKCSLFGARTIADLDASDMIEIEHILEVIDYRNLDRGSYVKIF